MGWMDWVFTAVSVIWLVEFIVFKNRETGQGDPVEKRTFFGILLSLIATIVVGFLFQELAETEMASVLRPIGLVLLIVGVFLRFWGIIHLKSQFTRHVTVREGDSIVSSGPYRKLRHPLYTGLFLIGIGMALFFTSLIAAVGGGLLLAFTLNKRMQHEEALLVEKFGPEYKEWMKRRARLIPYIY
ncbi:isoprenylcysteine carboxylmethyltransferase family protein [Planococcus sp. SIMBA_160]